MKKRKDGKVERQEKGRKRNRKVKEEMEQEEGKKKENKGGERE